MIICKENSCKKSQNFLKKKLVLGLAYEKHDFFLEGIPREKMFRSQKKRSVDFEKNRFQEMSFGGNDFYAQDAALALALQEEEQNFILQSVADNIMWPEEQLREVSHHSLDLKSEQFQCFFFPSNFGWFPLVLI